MTTIIYDATGNDFTPCEMRDVPPGAFFTFKPNLNNVYVKGDYDRAYKEYSTTHADDMNKERFVKSSKIVYINFTY